MNIDCVREPGGMVARLSGTIDIRSSGMLRRDFQRILAARETPIIVNMKDVDFVDSSGIATLVELLQCTMAYGGSLRLCNFQASVREVFALAKLDTIFDIFDTEETALGA